MKKTAFIIQNITEYGKLISYCVYRSYYVGNATWPGAEKRPCGFYILDYDAECLYFVRSLSKEQIESDDYRIILPIFEPDEYGYDLIKSVEYNCNNMFDPVKHTVKYL